MVPLAASGPLWRERAPFGERVPFGGINSRSGTSHLRSVPSGSGAQCSAHRAPPARNAATRSADAAVVLLAIHARALAVFAALNATLFTGANMSVGRRIGLLAINVGLAPLQ